MLIPSYAKNDVDTDVAADRHPTMDYYALQGKVNADLADYAAVDRDNHPLVRLARKLGKDAALAAYGFVRRNQYDVIFSNGENVSIPLAGLFSLTRKRPAHVLIGHHLSTPKKRLLLRRLHRHMDAIFVYAKTQADYAVAQLGMAERKLRLIPFHADHRFYRPMSVNAKRMVSSAGMEWRDYPTLIDAVDGLDVEVRLAAASPWSKHVNETEKRELPPNVSAKRYSYAELRDLYAESTLVVVPLYENDFQAGVTTLLEAMAMGKPVVITRTVGQRDVVDDGKTGIYVDPADRQALRAAIVRLLDDPVEAERIGAGARRAIEQNMTLELWAERIAQVIRELA